MLLRGSQALRRGPLLTHHRCQPRAALVASSLSPRSTLWTRTLSTSPPPNPDSPHPPDTPSPSPPPTNNANAKPPRSFLARKTIAYAELSKLRLSSLVVFTSGAGFLCAGGPVEPVTMAAVCVGTALCAGSAGALNQLLERRQDALMYRTMHRPLPSGRVAPLEAAAFGGLTGAAGASLLLAFTNPLTAALGVSNIALYAGLYTWSKQRSELNTWIGSMVGAVPPVMGWTAATGGTVGALLQPEPAALAALLFLWQFPHFFALSWMHRQDYARGGFKVRITRELGAARTYTLITHDP